MSSRTILIFGSLAAAAGVFFWMNKTQEKGKRVGNSEDCNTCVQLAAAGRLAEINSLYSKPCVECAEIATVNADSNLARLEYVSQREPVETNDSVLVNGLHPSASYCYGRSSNKRVITNDREKCHPHFSDYESEQNLMAVEDAVAELPDFESNLELLQDRAGLA